MSDFSLAEAMINFASGTDANWNNFQLPIAKDVIIYTTNTKTFKVGNGNQKYSELPVSCSIEGINTGSGQVNTVLSSLLPTDTDSIIFINNEKYAASSTKLTSIIDRLTAIGSKDAAQDANIVTINSQSGLIDNTITAGDNGKLAIIKTNKMAPGVLPSSLGSSIVVPPITVKSVKFFSDEACTKEVLQLASNSTYYCKVDCQHDTVDVDTLTITLTENNAFVTVTSLGHGIFRIVTTKPAVDLSVPFTATVAYNTDTVNVTKNITVTRTELFSVLTYGGSGTEVFNGVAIDSGNNIISVGRTTSEGTGTSEALIVKTNNNLGMLFKKTYGGSGGEQFYNVAVDASDNIYAVGETYSEGPANANALIVKFDSSLTVLARKYVGGAGVDVFLDVDVDSNGNIFCVGYTTSEGNGRNEALVIKFDSNLNISSQKRYGGNFQEVFYGVCVDSANNVICVGHTTSQRSGGTIEHEVDCLIVKFDNSLNILAQKDYYGTGEDNFYAVTSDSSNNIYAVGYTGSEGTGYFACLIVKFDSNLSILARKIFGGTNYEYFSDVCLDGNGNVYCSGYTLSEGPANANVILVKFDSNLNLVFGKTFGGSGNEKANAIGMITVTSKPVLAGFTESEGAGGSDGLVVKFPTITPTGMFAGSVFTGIRFYDSGMALANSALTLINATLTLTTSGLTATNSNITLADSNLTAEYDFIG